MAPFGSSIMRISPELSHVASLKLAIGGTILRLARLSFNKFSLRPLPHFSRGNRRLCPPPTSEILCTPLPTHIHQYTHTHKHIHTPENVFMKSMANRHTMCKYFYLYPGLKTNQHPPYTPQWRIQDFPEGGPVSAGGCFFRNTHMSQYIFFTNNS